jgi:hypothetical protein
MAYRPEIFRTIFKTTQNPTMPTIKVATAVNTVVAVVVMVEGSANVAPPPLLWARAEAAPMEAAATTATVLLILFLTVCILSFRLTPTALAQTTRRKQTAGEIEPSPGNRRRSLV